MRILSVLGLSVMGCAGASPPSSTPAGVPSHREASAQGGRATGTSTPTDDPGLPSECADAAAPVCTPPGDFVDRLCERPFQDVTLSLFARGTPFSRGYLRGKLDELSWDEEVLIVRYRGPQKGGIIVGSNLGTYDVL